MSSQPSTTPAPEPVYRTALERIIREDGRRQDWLAARAGISVSHMSYLVSGDRVPSDETAQRIANALGRDRAEVFPA